MTRAFVYTLTVFGGFVLFPIGPVALHAMLASIVGLLFVHRSAMRLRWVPLAGISNVALAFALTPLFLMH